MPFTDGVKREMYDRAQGRCECSRQHDGADAPHHGGRCEVTFTFVSGSGLTDWWEPSYKQAEASGGASTAANGEALCIKCYELVTASRQQALAGL